MIPDRLVCRQGPASPELRAWSARQEAERERIRKLGHTPQPPQRPPKKACLRQPSTNTGCKERLGLTQEILTDRRAVGGQKQLFSRSASDGSVAVPAPAEKHLTKQTSLQIEIG